VTRLLVGLTIGLFLPAAASVAAADTYLIKPDGTGDFPTIQAAINFADTGDVIELADGVFTGDGNWDLVVSNKAITIRSQSLDPDLCILDCEGGTDGGHWGILFETVILPTRAESALEGVTVTHATYSIGAGLVIVGGSPTITNCKIVENLAMVGAGVVCKEASPLFSGCTIARNLAMYLGAGVCAAEGGSPRFETCTVDSNAVLPMVLAVEPVEDPPPARAELSELLETYTRRLNGEGKGFLPGGAGLCFGDSCSPTLVGCAVRDNFLFLGPIKGMYKGAGVGVSCLYTAATTIEGCEIRNNRVEFEIPVEGAPEVIIFGGGIFEYGDSLRLVGCKIHDNSTGLLLTDLTELRSSLEWPEGLTLAEFLGELWDDPDGPFPVMGLGGGAALMGRGTSVADCSFRGNISFLGGGVLVLTEPEGGTDGPSGVPISGSLICENLAYAGAGLVVSADECRFQNCTVSANYAYKGGGLYFAEFLLTAVGGDLWDRVSGTPGGIGMKGALGVGKLFVENTILWGNCADIPELEEAAFELPGEFTCSDVDSAGVAEIVPGTVTWGPGNIFVDPMFCLPGDCEVFPPTPGHYRLQVGSPCGPDAQPVCGLIGSEPAGCELDVCHVATWGSDVTGDGSEDSPFFTIQHGLNRAQPGQTVLVHCGAYFEHEIVMKSGVILTSETGAPGCVTVDANEECRVFSVIGADDATVIEGLTITGGTSGGMYCAESFLTIRNCLFTGNTTDGYGGGGLHCHYASPTLEHCAFVENASVQYGAGMYCYESSPKLLDCLFEGNTATTDGGGARCCDSEPVFEGCVFRGNHADDGGGLYCERCVLMLNGCVFDRNHASTRGGGLYGYYTAPTVVSHCTFSDNGAPQAGGMYFWCRTAPMVANTIVAFSPQGESIRCLDSDSTPDVHCCDFFGNVGGDWVGCIAPQAGIQDNFAADPLFCDRENGDFTLWEDSPCTVDNSPPGCGLIGALGIGCGVTPVAEVPLADLRGFQLAPNVPNPFNPSTEIAFSVPAGADPSRVTLTVYNALGQRIRTLLDAERAGGVYSVVWNGTDERCVDVASGVYFCRLTWNGESRTTRMVMLK